MLSNQSAITNLEKRKKEREGRPFSVLIGVLSYKTNYLTEKAAYLSILRCERKKNIKDS